MNSDSLPEAGRKSSPHGGSEIAAFAVSVVVMLAAMVGSIYSVCDEPGRISVLGFVALWLRELVILVVVAVVALTIAALRIRTVIRRELAGNK